MEEIDPAASASVAQHSLQRLDISHKRPRDIDDDDEPYSSHNDQGFHKHTRRRLWTPTSDNASRRWACPLRQFDPDGGSRCGNQGGGFESVSRVKTHLRDWHDQARRCKRCWAFIRAPGTQQREALQRHEQAKACASKSRPRMHWLRDEAKHTLSETQYVNDVEGWYNLLAAVVPDLQNDPVEALKYKYSPWYDTSPAAPRYQSTPPALQPTPQTTPPQLASQVATARLHNLTSSRASEQAHGGSANPEHLSTDFIPGTETQWTGLQNALGLSYANSFGAEAGNCPTMELDDPHKRLQAPFPLTPAPAYVQTDSTLDYSSSFGSGPQPHQSSLRQKARRDRDTITSTIRKAEDVENQLQEIKNLIGASANPILMEKIEQAATDVSSMLCRLYDA